MQQHRCDKHAGQPTPQLCLLEQAAAQPQAKLNAMYLHEQSELAMLLASF
jgi:hypothetical protein